MISIRQAAAAGMLITLLAGCGSEQGTETSEVIQSNEGKDQVDTSILDAKDLGSVDLPRPAWLPADFPLPADAHIFTTVNNDKQTPPIYMIQARTRASGDEVADAAVKWGKAKGLTAERLETNVKNLALASIQGKAEAAASLQVQEKPNGINTIILAVNGLPW